MTCCGAGCAAASIDANSEDDWFNEGGRAGASGNKENLIGGVSVGGREAKGLSLIFPSEGQGIT